MSYWRDSTEYYHMIVENYSAMTTPIGNFQIILYFTESAGF